MFQCCNCPFKIGQKRFWRILYPCKQQNDRQGSDLGRKKYSTLVVKKSFQRKSTSARLVKLFDIWDLKHDLLMFEGIRQQTEMPFWKVGLQQTHLSDGLILCFATFSCSKKLEFCFPFWPQIWHFFGHFNPRIEDIGRIVHVWKFYFSFFNFTWCHLQWGFSGNYPSVATKRTCWKQDD